MEHGYAHCLCTVARKHLRQPAHTQPVDMNIKNNSSRLFRYVTEFSLVVGIFFYQNGAMAQTKVISDRHADSYDTNLPTLEEGLSVPYWVNDDHVLVSVVQDGVDPEGPIANLKPKIVLLDYRSKTYKTVVNDARILEHDEIDDTYYVGKYDSDYSVTGHDRKCIDCRYIKIDANGNVSDAPFLTDDELQRRQGIGRPLAGSTDYIPLNQQFGYLTSELKPGDTYTKRFERHIKDGEGMSTTWNPPDKPPMVLPVRYEEIVHPIYIKFLDKFLLDWADSAGYSETDSHLNSVWTRPYEYPPFRLLARDGTIEEIPYPSFVFEYGLAHRPWTHSQSTNFDLFLPTRQGILVTKWDAGYSSLYLFEHGQLHRITFDKTHFGFINTRSNAIGGLWFMELSPDGCKIAYNHYNVEPRFATASTARYVGIINFCESTQ